jgi:uncharacterized protein (TIGR00295 family)
MDAVAELASSICKALSARGVVVDEHLVLAGAWLHDVGRSRSQGVDHASLGGRLLREQGVAEEVCRVVERHTGGGIDAMEAAALGLPVADYTPQTIEEKVVCVADKLVNGTKRQKASDEVAYLRSQGLERAAAKVASLCQEIEDLVARPLSQLE